MIDDRVIVSGYATYYAGDEKLFSERKNILYGHTCA
jgi:hypothetical protein